MNAPDSSTGAALLPRAGGLAEPRWVGVCGSRSLPLPRDICHWLRDPGSLTRAVIRACDGPFRVRVRGQSWVRPLPSEARRLALPPGQRALLREVELMCAERPLVYARTLIPITSLRGPARRLTQLGTRPLGAVLFADPATRRRALEVARLTDRHALYHAACANLDVKPQALWGRRTLFMYAGHPLLVNETFLPGLPARRAPVGYARRSRVGCQGAGG